MTTTTELTVAVSELTATRFERLLELENTIGSDSLVNLALDAYLALAALDVPAYSEASPTTAEWLERRREVLAGSHYSELEGAEPEGSIYNAVAAELVELVPAPAPEPEPGFVTRWRAEYEPDSLDEAIVDAILADPLAALGDVQKVLFVLAGLTTYAAANRDYGAPGELADELASQDGDVLGVAGKVVHRFGLWLRYPGQHAESYLRDA